MGVVLTIPLYGIVLYFYYFTMSDTPLGTPEMQGAVQAESTSNNEVMVNHAVEEDRPLSVVELAESFRDDLKYIEERARYFAKMGIKTSPDKLHDIGETIAQAMLALRHIEDARMRFGKVIQYATTGVSSFQK